MFYICIPSNIISLPDVWNHGYIEIYLDGIVFNMPIKIFTFTVKANSIYYVYKVNSTLTSGIYYKIRTITNKSYLITNDSVYISNYNYNTIIINNNIYDNGIASIYHEKNDIIIKIGDKIIEKTI